MSPELEAFRCTYANAFAVLNRLVQCGLKEAIFIFLGIVSIILILLVFRCGLFQWKNTACKFYTFAISVLTDHNGGASGDPQRP